MDGESLWQLVGGVGLFLLGMKLMSDGLMSTGTRTLRRVMGRVTRSRWSGLATGAGVTAVVQSSSATTLVTVSFVSAGVVSFEQSIAVMLGANLGTTSTSWIVSLIGLKVSSGAFALPAIGLGALLHLVSRGRRQALGMAIAGFGLVFLGIDFLQLGMASVAEDLRPQDLALGGVLGTLALVALGALMTVVMQSSSAAVATTLAAVHAGSIDFEQAAAMVIGQNIGTTATAILGAVGGSLSAKRAAVTHLLFNLSTATIALIALSPFAQLVESFGRAWLDATPEVLVALFHTAFNLLGVALIFPIIPHLARLVRRLVPERADLPTQRLATATLATPAVALESARLAALEVGARAVRGVSGALRDAARSPDAPGRVLDRAARVVREPRRLLIGGRPETAANAARAKALGSGVDALRAFLAKLGPAAQGADTYAEHIATLYAIDHIQRLVDGLAASSKLERVRSDGPLASWATGLADVFDAVARGLGADTIDGDGDGDGPVEPGAERARAASFAALVETLEAQAQAGRAGYRDGLLQRAVGGTVPADDLDELLDASRWLVEMAHSARRVAELLVWPHAAGRSLSALPPSEVVTGDGPDRDASTTR